MACRGNINGANITDLTLSSTSSTELLDFTTMGMGCISSTTRITNNIYNKTVNGASFNVGVAGIGLS